MLILRMPLCEALATPEMAAYHYLTSLDFVKDASRCKPAEFHKLMSVSHTCSSF
jgi:hypothetical protein